MLIGLIEQSNEFRVQMSENWFAQSL